VAVDAASPTAGTPGRVGIGSYRGYPRVHGWLEWNTPEKHSFEEAPKDPNEGMLGFEIKASPPKVYPHDFPDEQSVKEKFGNKITFSQIKIMQKKIEQEQEDMENDPIMKELPRKPKQDKNGRWYTPKRKDQTKR